MDQSGRAKEPQDPPPTDQARSDQEERFRRLIEQNVDGVLVIGGDGLIRFANPSALALLSRDGRPLVGQDFGQPLIPGESTELDIPRDGQVRVAELRTTEIQWEGEPVVLATLRDITEKKNAMESLRFLADAGSALAHSLDHPSILATVVKLLTSRLAQGCIIDLLDGSSSIRRAAAGLADDHEGHFASKLVGSTPFEPERNSPILWVLRSGRSRLFSDVGDTLLCSLARDLEQVAVLRQLDIRSVMIVPLVARDRTLGAITLLNASSSARFSPDHVELAEELARRAALAIDNASLFEGASEAVRRRDEFLAVLAHELRNPLAPIIHSVALLKLTLNAPPNVQRFLDVIDRQGRQLSRLLDDLLDVARVTRGAIRLDRVPLDLRTVVRQAAEACSPLIEACEHRLDLLMAAEPLGVLGDPTRLEQVVVNLLNNAAHYTPRGGLIQVEAFLVGSEIELRVRDNGRGMTPSAIARAFDLFARGDAAPTRNEQGLGVGLTLVRRLVEMHGGRVSASSPGPGLGSEFVVRLPVLDLATSRIEPTTPDPDNPVKPLRVLVVEDLPDNREMLKDLLELWGHQVNVAVDGLDGLRAVRALKPDISFVDLGLPGISGLELAEQVTADPELADLFLVALTGYAQPEDCRKAREAGFAAHLLKPVNLEELVRVLRRAQTRLPD